MRTWIAACVALLAATPLPAAAEDAAFEITEAGLTKFVSRLGTLSNTEVFRPTRLLEIPGFEFCDFVGFLDCPGGMAAAAGFSGGRIPLARCMSKGGGIALVPSGEALLWQWWIGNVQFNITSSGMTFSALVRAQIGADKRLFTKTVPASLTFHAPTNSLRLVIDPFKASFPVQMDGDMHSLQVDVAKLLSVSVPIEPQDISLGMPNGSTRALTGRVVSASPQYLAGKVRINFDVAY